MKPPPARTPARIAHVLAAALALAALPFRAGVAGAVAAPLTLIVEPNAGLSPIDALLASAHHSLDLVMYELVDQTAETILASDAARGVKVRVLLDRSGEERENAAAFSYLEDHRVVVRWADPSYNLTHEKAFVVDGATAVVMTLNFTSRYYATTRDLAVVDRQAPDVGAIEATFDADWADRSVTPPVGSDLLWAPGAESALLSLVDSAHRSVLVENEEMDDAYVTRALEAAARRGVRVEVVMTDSSEWSESFSELGAAGVAVHVFSPSATPYIHAKAIVVDPGSSSARVFVGSENLSVASLLYNRELGILTSSAPLVAGIAAVISEDFRDAPAWH